MTCVPEQHLKHARLPIPPDGRPCGFRSPRSQRHSVFALLPICRVSTALLRPSFFRSAIILRDEKAFSAEPGPAKSAGEPSRRNEILDQLAIGTDRRILAPFPSGDGRFVDTEFCQLLLGQLNLDAGRQFATLYAICV
jgi:hypothetical protein